jgi:hypothetical protein
MNYSYYVNNIIVRTNIIAIKSPVHIIYKYEHKFNEF